MIQDTQQPMKDEATSQLTSLRKAKTSSFLSFDNPFDRQVRAILSTTPSQALRSDFNRIGQDIKKAVDAYEEKSGKNPETRSRRS